MKIIATCVLVAGLAAAASAYAATAFWTGQQQQVQTVTGTYAWNCEYNYAGQTFWKVFTGSCPPSIEIQ